MSARCRGRPAERTLGPLSRARGPRSTTSAWSSGRSARSRCARSRAAARPTGPRRARS